MLPGSLRSYLDHLRLRLRHQPAPHVLPHPPDAIGHKVVPATSRGGHVHVVDWWLRMGWPEVLLATVVDAIFAVLVSRNRHMAVLQWWATASVAADGRRSPWSVR
ncbi:hypothetical protein DFJ73DRAFT_774921 [Zopfochytrium polystomum]|nr:hypothetical protein DFJ73DRAFT_774921 [Zopfochytrium polystomum]